MSSDVAIRIENLGKRYRYGRAAPLSTNLRADLTDWIKGLIRRQPQVEEKGLLSNSDSSRSSANTVRHETLREVRERHIAESEDYFWALRDINLEIKKGEVIGVIGRNGAGKSTLLKILSRITSPTIGKVIYNGKMASLLEVGTGFHRELTGRENIFLNGSILGMKRADITKNFNEIVSFSEVEKFIDTPVKYYSSGMYVRLAFAVAAHLEPEILLVDEVLAVGDAAFQKKCLGKMGDVARQGRTILFVSHNMGAITALCSKCAYLVDGRLKSLGETKEVIQEYMSVGVSSSGLKDRNKRTGSGRLRFTSVQIMVDDLLASHVHTGQKIRLLLFYNAIIPITPMTVRIGVSFVASTGVELVSFDSAAVNFEVSLIPCNGMFVCSVPSLPLIGGVYQLWLYASINGEIADRVEDAAELEILSPPYPKSGFMDIPHEWSLSEM